MFIPKNVRFGCPGGGLPPPPPPPPPPFPPPPPPVPPPPFPVPPLPLPPLPLPPVPLPPLPVLLVVGELPLLTPAQATRPSNRASKSVTAAQCRIESLSWGILETTSPSIRRQVWRSDRSQAACRR